MTAGDPGEPIPSGTSESFRRSEEPGVQLMRNLGTIAKKAISLEDVGKEAWAFPTESTTMLRVVTTPSEKVICQDQGKIYSLDRITGKKEWELTKDRGGISDFAAGPDGTVYLDEHVHGSLHAVDGSTGKEKWSHDLGGLEYVDVVEPASDGALFIGGLEEKGGESYKRIVSLDARSGAVKWEARTKSNTVSQMKVSADRKTCVADVTDAIAAFDTSSGKLRWKYPLKGIKTSYASSVGPTGTVYFSADDNKLRAIDGMTGKKKWEFPISDDMHGLPLIAPDGSLCLFGKGRVIAIDGDNGKKKWEFDAPKQILWEMGFTPEGSLQVYDRTGEKLLVIDREKGTLKESFSVAAPPFKATTSPDGYIYYAGDDNKVHCIKARYTEDDLKKIADNAGGAEEDARKDTIEREGEWVIIGGIKIPVTGA
jgi:outer membrane protein assembly factor BamB